MTATAQIICANCDTQHDCWRDGHLLTQDVTPIVPRKPGERPHPRRYICGACGETIEVPACEKCGCVIRPASESQLALGRQAHQPILPVRQQGSVQSFGINARESEEG